MVVVEYPGVPGASQAKRRGTEDRTGGIGTLNRPYPVTIRSLLPAAEPAALRAAVLDLPDAVDAPGLLGQRDDHRLLERSGLGPLVELHRKAIGPLVRVRRFGQELDADLDARGRA